MRSLTCLVLAGVLGTGAGAALAGEKPRAGFTRKPTATRQNGKVRIEFAVDRQTDVAVWIENAKGQVVRHLAAGVLGKNAPKPLKSGSLAQSVQWDGKADGGGPAGSGPFRARVSLGLTPVFDANMFDDPQRLLGLHGLGIGPAGEVYTRGSGGDGGWGPESDYRVFGRDGKYLRTIAPFPAGLEPERVAGFGAFRTGENGTYIPRVHEINHYCFYPAKMGEVRSTQLAVDGQGRVFFLSGNKRMQNICVLDTDGGVPAGWSFKGKGIAAGKPKITGGYLAMSSDGRRIYLSGCPLRRSGRLPAVFRTDAKERGALEVLCGDPAKEGSGKTGLKSPLGIAADGKGHLLVADNGNGRVAVVSEADGKIVGEFAVPDACMVAVDRKTGAVYVLTYSSKTSALIKFSNWKAHKEICRLPLNGSKSRDLPFLAVSPSTEKEGAVAWVGALRMRYKLLRIPDLGTKFGDARENCPDPGPLMEDVFVDRARNEVYVNLGPYYHRFPDGGGNAERVPIKVSGNSGLTLRVGPKGNIYGHAWGNKFHRWDHNGKPLAFKGTGKNIISIPSMMVYQLRGLHIDQLRGEVYLVQPNATRKTPDCFGSVVRVYDLEGKLKREAIRSVNPSSTVGPAVDAAGNIYVGEPSRPDTHELPAFFKGKLPDIKVEAKGRFRVPKETFPYSWAYGSVVKFSPGGGSVPWGKSAGHKLYKPFKEAVPGATNPVMYRQANSSRIEGVKSQGVLWAHGEFYPLPSRVMCNCLASYFDVDYFGRSFYPDAARSRVGVLDTNGNVICRFGAYGNREAAGGDGHVPLAMGIAVAASDRYIYVADICNQRLVRVKMSYAAEETCSLQ